MARESRDFTLSDGDMQRFWSYVDRRGADECWLWTGGTNRHAYGRMALYHDRKFRLVYAHRVSFKVHHGDIGPDLLVCHTCDNPPCVNPAHLFAGTVRDNMADASTKGRCHRQQPLTPEERREVVASYKRGETVAAIAKRLGVGAERVRKHTRGIRRGWVRHHNSTLEPCGKKTASRATKYVAPMVTAPVALSLVQSVTRAVFGRLDAMGLSQIALAERVGTSRQHVNQVRAGGIATLKMLAVLADAVECDVQITLTPRDEQAQQKAS